MLQRLRDWLNECNYRRLLRRKIKRLNGLASYCTADKSISDNTGSGVWPRQVQSLLLMDPLHCYGDSLYVNALLHRLLEDTPALNVTVLTEKHLFDIYRHNRCRLKNYKCHEDVNEISLETFDLIIDLDYKDDTEWEFRRLFYGRKRQCVVTLSPVVKNAKIFTGWIDLTGAVHFGKRMAMVAQFVKSAVSGDCRITGSKKIFYDVVEECLLEPRLDIDEMCDSKYHNCIYINTQGSKKERSLTQSQVNILAKWFNGQNKYKGLFYTGNTKYSLEESKTVKYVKTETFIEAAALAVECCGIVSPDTSMVHVAFAKKKPLMGIYARGKKEYPSEKYQFEVWGANYEKSVIFIGDCQSLDQISNKDIIKVFEKFIESFEN